MSQLSIRSETCCPSPKSADVAAKLAALAHPARLEILAQVAGKGACCCKDVVECLDLAQSTVSQHLKILVDAGLLIYRSDRQRSRYELDRASMENLSAEVARFAELCCAPAKKT
jgi:ArsR family transcriptional regulator